MAGALEALSLQNGLEPGYFGKNPGAQIYIHLTKPDTAEQGLAKLSELIQTLKNAKP